MDLTIVSKPRARDVSSVAAALTQDLVRYREPSGSRAVWELAVTAGMLLANWALMWAALGIGYWLTLLLAIPAAGFLVRLFMI